MPWKSYKKVTKNGKTYTVFSCRSPEYHKKEGESGWKRYSKSIHRFHRHGGSAPSGSPAKRLTKETISSGGQASSPAPKPSEPFYMVNGKKVPASKATPEQKAQALASMMKREGYSQKVVNRAVAQVYAEAGYKPQTERPAPSQGEQRITREEMVNLLTGKRPTREEAVRMMTSNRPFERSASFGLVGSQIEAIKKARKVEEGITIYNEAVQNLNVLGKRLSSEAEEISRIQDVNAYNRRVAEYNEKVARYEKMQKELENLGKFYSEYVKVKTKQVARQKALWDLYKKGELTTEQMIEAGEVKVPEEFGARVGLGTQIASEKIEDFLGVSKRYDTAPKWLPKELVSFSTGAAEGFLLAAPSTVGLAARTVETGGANLPGEVEGTVNLAVSRPYYFAGSMFGSYMFGKAVTKSASSVARFFKKQEIARVPQVKKTVVEVGYGRNVGPFASLKRFQLTDKAVRAYKVKVSKAGVEYAKVSKPVGVSYPAKPNTYLTNVIKDVVKRTGEKPGKPQVYSNFYGKASPVSTSFVYERTVLSTKPIYTSSPFAKTVSRLKTRGAGLGQSARFKLASVVGKVSRMGKRGHAYAVVKPEETISVIASNLKIPAGSRNVGISAPVPAFPYKPSSKEVKYETNVRNVDYFSVPSVSFRAGEKEEKKKKPQVISYPISKVPMSSEGKGSRIGRTPKPTPVSIQPVIQKATKKRKEPTAVPPIAATVSPPRLPKPPKPAFAPVMVFGSFKPKISFALRIKPKRIRRKKTKHEAIPMFDVFTFMKTGKMYAKPTKRNVVKMREYLTNILEKPPEFKKKKSSRKGKKRSKKQAKRVKSSRKKRLLDMYNPGEGKEQAWRW